MEYCRGCLKEGVSGFCSACSRALFDRSSVPAKLPFNWNDIEDRIYGLPGGFSISGVQPKGLIGRDRNRLLVPNRDVESMYIIKPALESNRLLSDDSPANEHITMLMAGKLFDIPTARPAFMEFADSKPAYLTRRFDRDPRGKILRQEDFVSVLSATPKYYDRGLYKYTAFSYEDVGRRLNPVDRIRLLKLLLYNFLTGNGDVHLKNLSILESPDGDMILSPAYDLMNTKLHVNDSDLAMNMFREMERAGENSRGAEYSYTIRDFIELARRLGIKSSIIDSTINHFRKSKEQMQGFVGISFLPDTARNRYREVISGQFKKLFG